MSARISLRHGAVVILLLLMAQIAAAVGFEAKNLLAAYPGAKAVALADLNHDGKLDLGRSKLPVPQHCLATAR